MDEQTLIEVDLRNTINGGAALPSIEAEYDLRDGSVRVTVRCPSAKQFQFGYKFEPPGTLHLWVDLVRPDDYAEYIWKTFISIGGMVIDIDGITYTASTGFIIIDLPYLKDEEEIH